MIQGSSINSVNLINLEWRSFVRLSFFVNTSETIEILFIKLSNTYKPLFILHYGGEPNFK